MCSQESFLARRLCLREWLSGGAPPCQGGGRGFDPRLALFYFIRKSVFIWLPLFYLCKKTWHHPAPCLSLRLRSANNTLSLITLHKQPLYLILFLNCRHHRLLLIPHQQSLLFRLHMSQLYLM